MPDHKQEYWLEGPYRFTSPHLQCQFEATSTWRMIFRVPKGRCQHVCQWQAISLANKAVEKAVVDNGLGKKHGQYFMNMVASDAASSFVLFHAARSLELLEWWHWHGRVRFYGNFENVQHEHFPIYGTKICVYDTHTQYISAQYTMYAGQHVYLFM